MDLGSAPTRDQVVLYAPRTNVPVAGQPALRDLLVAPRRRLRDPVRWLLVAILAVALVHPGHPVGIVAPAVLLAAVLAGAVVSATRLGGLGALSAAPTRLVVLEGDDLRQAGRTVALRLPDDGRWAVARLPVADRMMLARLRRVWVFGPTRGGRLGLVVPGGSTPRVVRLATAPPGGAGPVPPPEPVPAGGWPPAQDSAFQVALTTRLARAMWALTLVSFAMPLIMFEAMVVDGIGSLAVATGWTVVTATVAVGCAFEANRIAAARRAPGWRWIPVLVGDLAVRPRPRLTVGVGGSGMVIHGSPALVLTIHETGHLWIAGELRRTGRMVVGIPGVPVSGTARVIRSG